MKHLSLRLFVTLCLLTSQISFAQHSGNGPATASKRIEAGTLSPNAPAERDIKGGEMHVYQLTLAAGDYLRLRVEQNDIDLNLALLSADGAKLAESDLMLSSHGFETLFFLAAAAGEYKIEIRANKKTAPPQRYEVKVEELRQATAADRRHVEAFRAIQAADVLFKKWQDEAQRQAVAGYETALATLGDNGDVTLGDNVTVALRARALKSIALAYEFLREYRQAAETYEKALPLLQNTDDRQEPAFTHIEIARSYAAIHQYQKVIEHREKALHHFRVAGKRAREMETLNTLALTYNDIGEKQKAINLLHESLELARAAGATDKESQTLNFLGIVYQAVLDNESALFYYTQALRLIEGKNSFEESFLLHNLGRTYSAFGNHNKALEYYEKALPLMRAFKNRDGEAFVLIGLGMLRYYLNDYTAALDAFSTALQIHREAKVAGGEAIALNHLGLCYAKLGDDDKALDAHRQALAITTAIEEQTGEVMSRYYVALLESRRGNLAEALNQMTRTMQVMETLRAKIEIEDLRASLFDGYQQCNDLYIDLLMRSGSGSENAAAAFQANERFRARTLLDSLQESKANLTQGVDKNLLAQKRELSRKLNQQAVGLTRLLNRKHAAEEATTARREIEATTIALQAVKAKVRQASPRFAELTDPQSLTLADIQKQVLDDDTVLLEYALGEERSYLWAITTTKITAYTLPKRAEINKAAGSYYSRLTARNRVVRHETVDEKRERIATADAELPQAASALARMVLAPVAAELRRKRVLIVSDGSLQYIPFAALPGDGGLGSGVGDRNSNESITEQRTTKNHASPPASRLLPPAPRPLSADHEVVSLPSASTLAALRDETSGRKLAPKTVAIFADPVFDKRDSRLTLARTNQKVPTPAVAQARGANIEGSAAGHTGTPTAVSFAGRKAPLMASVLTRAAREAGIETEGAPLPRLPFTRQEAKTIAALVPTTQRRQAMDFDANKSSAQSEDLSQYRYVHFATHGFVSATHPELSGVALSMVDEEGRERDGFLRTHEIYNLKLPVELVVLSGCRTGLGKELRGEGLIGMTRGFMYAGAARVLVSLWDVNDEATAEFMGHFYQAMLGREKMTPAAALRAAQTTMAKDKRWSSPYYWAAFVLQGEPK